MHFIARFFFSFIFFVLELAGETNKEWVGGLIVIIVYCLINIGTFRLCGQDIIRSVIFGMSSALLPAGNFSFSLFLSFSHPLSVFDTYCCHKND
jgi:hypothetical protein